MGPTQPLIRQIQDPQPDLKNYVYSFNRMPEEKRKTVEERNG